MTERRAPSGLDCVLEHRDQAVVMSVTGQIDLATQHVFAEAVHEMLDRETLPVVIDLAGVTFLGSPGLAVLVEAQEKAMRLQRDLHVATGNDIVRRSIELTGLAKILPLVPTVQIALNG